MEIAKGIIALSVCLTMWGNRLPHFVSDIMFEMTVAERWRLGVAGTIYAMFRFAVGYGLWHRRRWAEWLAATSWAIYIPFEIYGLAQGVTRLNGAILILNLAIVLFLIWTLLSKRTTPVLSNNYCIRGILRR